MTLSIFNSMLQRVISSWPLLLYAAIWTTILTMTVAVASFSPEFSFIFAITPTSPFSQACGSTESLRLPMDIPTEVLCFPVHMFKNRSKVDWIVPPVFAALIVAVSAYAVRAMGFLQVEEDDDQNPLS